MRFLVRDALGEAMKNDLEGVLKVSAYKNDLLSAHGLKQRITVTH